MAISHKVTTCYETNSDDPWTQEVVVPSGTNLLVVGISQKDKTNTVSSITWNTTENFTHLRTDANSTAGQTHIYYLINPTVTTANVVIDWSANTKGHMSIVGYGGVDTSDVVDIQNGGSGDSTSASVILSGVTSGAWCFQVVNADGNYTILSFNYTERCEGQTGGSPSTRNAWGSQDANQSGDVTLTATLSGAKSPEQWSTSAFSFKRSVELVLRLVTLTHKNNEYIRQFVSFINSLKNLITQIITFKLNIRELILVYLSSLYSVIESLADVFSILLLKHRIGVSVSSDYSKNLDIGFLVDYVRKKLSSFFKITSLVYKSIALQFNIIKRTFQYLSLSFNMLSYKIRTFVFIFNIKNLVMKIITLGYSLLHKVLKILSIKWSLSTYIEKIIKTSYILKSFVIGQLKILYDVLTVTIVDTTLRILYSTKIYVSKYLSSAFNIIKNIYINITSLSGLRNYLSKSLIFIYGLREYIIQEIFIKYKIRNLIDKLMEVSKRFPSVPIFKDWFRIGGFDAWSGTQGTCVTVKSPVHHGNYSAKFGTGTAFVGKIIAGQPTYIYARCYFRLSVLPDEDGAYVMVFNISGNSGANIIAEVFIRYDTDHLVLQFGRLYPSIAFQDYAYDFAVDTWYCLEIGHYKHASEGFDKCWLSVVDPKDPILEWTNQNTSVSPDANAVFVGSFEQYLWLDYVYIDCVVVADEYIGPEIGGYNIKELVYKSTSLLYSILAQAVVRTLSLTHSLKALIHSRLSTLYSILEYRIKTLNLVYNIKNLITQTTALVYSIISRISKILVTIYRLGFFIEQTLSLVHSLSSIISRSLKGTYNLMSYRIKEFVLVYSLRKLVVNSLNVVYSLTQRIYQFLLVKYILGSWITKTLSFTYSFLTKIHRSLVTIYSSQEFRRKLLSLQYSLKIYVTRIFSKVYSIRKFIPSSIDIVYNMESLVSKILGVLYSLKILVPKIIGIKYGTRVSVSRILSTKFGITAFIKKIISLVYSLGGFYIQDVGVNPSKIHREEVEATVIRCDWYDQGDLDISKYKCEFWIRDEESTIHGPYSGSVTKESSYNYYADYSFDPDETFLLGKYDIKAEVTKYD